MKSFALRLLGIGSVLWDFIRPLLVSETQKALTLLLPIALGVVKELATTGKLPNEKRDIAYAQVKSDAIGMGLSLSDSLLNLIVETAVNKYKAQPGV